MMPSAVTCSGARHIVCTTDLVRQQYDDDTRPLPPINWRHEQRTLTRKNTGLLLI